MNGILLSHQREEAPHSLHCTFVSSNWLTHARPGSWKRAIPPESLNRMIKEWTNFVPQDLDKFVLLMYSFVESFDTETELAWFGISNKWEVREGFVQHMPRVHHVSMTAEE